MIVKATGEDTGWDKKEITAGTQPPGVHSPLSRGVWGPPVYKGALHMGRRRFSWAVF